MSYNARTAHRLIAVTLIILAAAFLVRYSWQDEVVGTVADDAIYLLLADYFSPYSSSTRSTASFVAQHGVFPPLYPFALALAGAGAGAVWWAHAITTLMVLAAMCAVWQLLLRSGAPASFAFVYATLYFLMPRSLLQHLELLSEPLYLALSLYALLCYQRLDGTGSASDGRRVMVVAMLIGLAAITRTAGVALVGAFVIWQLAGPRHQRVWPAIFLAFLPLVAWALVKPFVYAQIYVEYSQQLWVDYPVNDPARAIARLGQGFLDLWRGWRQFLDTRLSISSLPAALLLLSAAIPGWAKRLREKRLDAIYFLLFTAMIVVWPFPDHTPRLLYPVVPLLLYYVMVSVGYLREPVWRHGAHAVVIGTTLLAILPSSGQILVKALDSPAALGSYAKTRVLYALEMPMPTIEQNALIDHELVTAMRESGALVPRDQCVYVTHFERYMFYARRFARPIVPQDIGNNVLFYAPACRYMLVNFSNSHPDFRPGFPLSESRLNAAVVYERRMSTTNGTEGRLVAQLLLLMTPAEFDEARKAGMVK